MSDDAGYSIIERQAIRRAAEATLSALDVPKGQVTRVEASSLLRLLELLFRARVPLKADCYDLAAFDVASLIYSQPNMLRIGDSELDERVFAVASGLVLYFPETIGQAPVIYLESEERQEQEHLHVTEFHLDEWSKPIRYHQALLDEERILYKADEVKAALRAEMMGGKHYPELLSYLTPGISLAIHVAPRSFSYRLPEFSLSQIAHWPLDELHETLSEVMERMINSKSAGYDLG